MAYQNDGRDNANRNTRSYFLPLVILAIALVLGFIFLIPDENPDNLNATAPAAGSMSNQDNSMDNGTPVTP